MFCNYCGKVIQDDANLCAYCGKRVAAVVARRSLRRLRNRKIAGVCAGFAEYFDLDVTVIRVVWLLVAILGFPIGVIAYFICWIIMPEEPPVSSVPAIVPNAPQR